MNKFAILDKDRLPARQMTKEAITQEMYQLSLIHPDRATIAIKDRCIALSIALREKML